MQNKTKIVIADDNPLIRLTWKDILTEKGYLVEVFKNGYEVLGYLKEKTPDIIILDLIMPGESGFDILSTIKSISPNTKIIIYTGFQSYEDSIYSKVADRFLLKGGSIEEFLQVIKELAEDKGSDLEIRN